LDNKIILLIGGNPKGYGEPFHPKTLSGKRLLKLIDKHHLKTQLMDLWQTEEEEAIGTVDSKGIYYLQKQAQDKSIRIIALGYKVYHTLQNCNVPCEYLPHPASRRKIDLQKLEAGLLNKGGN